MSSPNQNNNNNDKKDNESHKPYFSHLPENEKEFWDDILQSLKRKHKLNNDIQDIIDYYSGEAEGCGGEEDVDSYDESEDLNASDVDSEGNLLGFVVSDSDVDYEPTDSEDEDTYYSDFSYDETENNNNTNTENNNIIIIKGEERNIQKAILDSLKPFAKKAKTESDTENAQ